MNDQELDRLLDKALSSYAAEPDPGLPARVIARARRPRLAWVAWAAGVAAAAALVVLWPMPSTPRLVAKHEPLPTPPPVVVRVRPTIPARVPRQTVTSKPAVRPRRSELTSEEKQLVALASAHPELVAQAFAPPPPSTPAPDPLEIAPIQIQPLTEPR